MNRQAFILGLLTLLVYAAGLGAANAQTLEQQLIDRGRYLVKITGCNDCHTAGYGESNGQLPEAQWLLGDSFGWFGPWGTTYGSNLRLLFTNLSEEQWLAYARSMRPRPPMPWFNLQAFTDDDLRAMYHFVRHLGPAGVAAPAYVPAGQVPPPPYATFPAPPQP